MLMEFSTNEILKAYLVEALDAKMDSVVPLFLSHFDRHPTSSGTFESVLPRLVPFFSEWKNDTYEWIPRLSTYSYWNLIPQFGRSGAAETPLPFSDTTVRVGEVGEDCEANSFSAHGALMSIASPLFDQHIVKSGNQFRIVLPSVNENAKTPGALNLEAARSLISSLHTECGGKSPSAANGLLLTAAAPIYIPRTSFLTSCYYQVLDPLELQDMVEVIAMACKLGYFVEDTAAPPELQARLLGMLSSLHAHAASVTTCNAWNSIDAHIRKRIMSHEPAQQTPPPRTFPIYVRTVSGESLTLLGTQSSTILDMKSQVHTKTGIPTRIMRLIFSGRQLEDSRLLSDYNIQRTSTMDLVPQLRGG